MNSGVGTMGKVTNSSIQLVVLYDPLNKKIEFSSSPLTTFFGSSINMPEEAVLSHLMSQDAETTDEWRACLQLKEKQSHAFMFAGSIPGGKLSLYQCRTTGIRIPDLAGQLYLLFMFDMGNDATNGTSEFNIERVQRILNNYRNEVVEFTDIAAHDLDAPLRKMSVLMDRVTDKLPEDSREEVKSYVDRIRTSLADMRSLVDSLAVLSRLTTDTVRYVSCDIAHVVDDLLTELKTVTDRQNAVVSVSGLPVIEGDPAQIRQLFGHLLENAFRFNNKSESIRIRIAGKLADKAEKEQWGLLTNREYYHIEIEDNGIGFRQEHAEQIFKPFVRMNGKSEFPGTGLGLAICKRIVNNHYGIIYAEGRESTGARFILLLPQTLN